MKAEGLYALLYPSLPALYTSLQKQTLPCVSFWIVGPCEYQEETGVGARLEVRHSLGSNFRGHSYSMYPLDPESAPNFQVLIMSMLSFLLGPGSYRDILGF